MQIMLNPCAWCSVIMCRLSRKYAERCVFSHVIDEHFSHVNTSIRPGCASRWSSHTHRCCGRRGRVTKMFLFLLQAFINTFLQRLQTNLLHFISLFLHLIRFLSNILKVLHEEKLKAVSLQYLLKVHDVLIHPVGFYLYFLIIQGAFPLYVFSPGCFFVKHFLTFVLRSAL